jgi:hypothetical protein
VIVDSSRNSKTLSFLAAALGTMAVLALSALSANAFVSERVNQTLEVLMTTPLAAGDMVQQKARMLMRFVWVVAIPLLTVFVVEWCTERAHSWRSQADPEDPCALFTLFRADAGRPICHSSSGFRFGWFENENALSSDCHGLGGHRWLVSSANNLLVHVRH